MKNNLKDILKSRKISQLKLAKDVDITHSAINRYVQGNRMPNGKNMLAIADYLNLKVEDIWEFKGEK